MFIGERIRKLRRQAELTQTKLAIKLSARLNKRIVYQQIQRIEEGSRNVRSLEVHAFAEIFGIDPKELLSVNGRSFFMEKEGEEGIITVEFQGEFPVKVFKEDGTLKIIYKLSRQEE